MLKYVCIFQYSSFNWRFIRIIFDLSINLEICKYPLIHKLICPFLCDVVCTLPRGRLKNAIWSDRSRILLLKVMRSDI